MIQKSAAQDAAGSRLDAAWLYDAIMSKIEPDLMTEALRGLSEKYVGEEEGARTARLQRYEEAFAAFDAALAAFDAHLFEEAREVKQQRRSKAAQRERTEQTKDVEAVERLLQHPTEHP
ncbi:MAG: hypothetical protein PHU04_04995 [Candidatus Peribacteraceae bacterium]|nr:hypothetical protein [Candidatus Peribacteraceae bacterium]